MRWKQFQPREFYLPPMDLLDGDDLSQHVMSEVHLGCPPSCSSSHISRFTFCLPPEPVRRCGITIHHSVISSIDGVGLQVWKAALVLADYVLHVGYSSSGFRNVIALDLGSGTGLLGIIVAQFVKTVFLTDNGDEILHNCKANVQRNSRLFEDKGMSVFVRELDWTRSWPPSLTVDTYDASSNGNFLWSASEIEAAESASLLLAADVIYNDDLTEAFFGTLRTLMTSGSHKVLYLALEKRYNFSIDDMDVVANGYPFFRSYLKDEEEFRRDPTQPCFLGKQIDITEIPKYIREYSRGEDLELWEIQSFSLPCK